MADEHRKALAWLADTPTEQFVEDRPTLAELLDAGLTEDEVVTALRNRPELPRDLLPGERQALVRILEHADFDGRDALLAQLPHTKVSRYCACGCATVDLEVTGDVPLATGARSPLPNEARVFASDGDEIGGVIVFLDNGKLSMLEVYSHFDPISPFPAGRALRVWGHSDPM